MNVIRTCICTKKGWSVSDTATSVSFRMDDIAESVTVQISKSTISVMNTRLHKLFGETIN